MPKKKHTDSLLVFTDNLLTSLPLMMALKNEDIGHTGTVRKNRLRGCPLTLAATMKKASRGDTCVALETNQYIDLERWKDNSVITLASTISSSDQWPRFKNGRNGRRRGSW